MSETRPLFSIVMPTRNRGHLLRHSLRSALAQTFDDYEILVSNNDSQDDTAKVIEEFAHPRLRSVRTSKTLPMPDHWEFAADHARGEYLTYLCDDDSLSPHALAQVAAAIDEYKLPLITMGSAVYHGENSMNVGCRNCLQLPHYHGGAEVMDSKETLDRMATSPITAIGTQSLPRMLNSFCHRDLFAQIRNATGRIFLLSPDFSFAITSIASVQEWLYLHQPLWVCGCFEESTGMNTIQGRTGASATYIKEMKDNKLLANTPLQLRLLNNFVVDTYLECKKLWPELLANFEFDLVAYFCGCWRDILILKSYGANITEDISQFEAALAQQPTKIRSKVQRSIGSWSNRLRNLFGYRIPESRLLLMIGTRLFLNWRCYWGDAHGFKTIDEAAQFLPTLGKQTAHRKYAVTCDAVTQPANA